MTFRDTAIAAFEASLQAERNTVVSAARTAVRDVVTDDQGKPALDVTKGLTVVQASTGPAAVVVFKTPDEVHLIATRSDDTFKITLGRPDSGRVVPVGPQVKALSDIGRTLKEALSG